LKSIRSDNFSFGSTVAADILFAHFLPAHGHRVDQIENRLQCCFLVTGQLNTPILADQDLVDFTGWHLEATAQGFRVFKRHLPLSGI
jgi:hypothetical protein